MDTKILRKISYGVYIVSSKRGEEINGQVANAVMQVTSDPPRVAVALNKDNLTHEFVKDSGMFTVCILAQETPLKLIGLFGFKSGRETDKFADVPCRMCDSGCPVVVEHSLGYVEARVIQQLDLGTHTLFVGEVIDAQVLAEGEPMTYAYYHQVKKGTTPSKAPTFVEAEPTTAKKEGTTMKKYVCQVCGYVYNPEEGDADGGIAAGTSFEQLPEDWVCPVCGATKDQFEPEG